jgi:eukaryotic-like serine/threonine-protein kinase
VPVREPHGEALGNPPAIPEVAAPLDEDLDHAEDPAAATHPPAEDTQVAAPAARRRHSLAPAGAGIHDQPTQAIPATRGLPAAAAEDTRQSSMAMTPLDALRGEEVVRTRLFLKVCIAIAVAAAGVVGLAGGDALARLVVLGGCALTALTALWMIWLTRDPAKFTTRRLTVVAALVAVGAYGGVYYWGIVSPVAALILFGIYFFSFGGSFAATLGIYLLVALMQATLATAIIAGWIEDRGLIKSAQLSLRDQVLSQLVVQFLFACAFVTARASRRTLIAAIDGLEKAVRAVSQREALLAEARAELDRALRVGGPGRYTDQVIGSFRLGLLLGRGGMGEVYEATSVHDGSEAAVKLLHPGALADPQHVRRFLRETEAAARLSSAHVVTVLEVGTTSGEIPFLAMERLRGFDLAHHLRRKRRLGLAQVVAMVRQVGEGLAAARAAAIVHRDLKPHNLFLAEEGGVLTWKILDFGVSKVGKSGTLTRGHVVGTPGYMAPEQARGDEVDARADLYALAAIVYRCLTGHPPFTGKDVPTTLYDVVYKMPTRPSALVELPTDVDRVLAIGMAKLAGDRFADASELADALAAAATAQLAEGLRVRADELIARHPWGERR